MNSLTFAINRETGYIVSRLESDVAWPILNYAAIGEGGNYNAPFKYYLESCNVHQIGAEYKYLHWTKKVPVPLKEFHREFWSKERGVKFGKLPPELPFTWSMKIHHKDDSATLYRDHPSLCRKSPEIVCKFFDFCTAEATGKEFAELTKGVFLPVK